MGFKGSLAEMSMPVLQAEPRCVADAALTAAIAYRAKPSRCVWFALPLPKSATRSAEWANGLAVS